MVATIDLTVNLIQNGKVSVTCHIQIIKQVFYIQPRQNDEMKVLDQSLKFDFILGILARN
jgi:hypothetical protein